MRGKGEENQEEAKAEVLSVNKNAGRLKFLR